MRAVQIDSRHSESFWVVKCRFGVKLFTFFPDNLTLLSAKFRVLCWRSVIAEWLQSVWRCPYCACQHMTYVWFLTVPPVCRVHVLCGKLPNKVCRLSTCSVRLGLVLVCDDVTRLMGALFTAWLLVLSPTFMYIEIRWNDIMLKWITLPDNCGERQTVVFTADKCGLWQN